MHERAVGLSRAPFGRGLAVALALALSPPAGAQPAGEALRILGFRRQLAPDAIELVLACSGPVSFRYSSPTLETIRLVIPGVDPTGVTPPREAWGEDLAEVDLAPAEGDEAPGAILVLELPEFRPYSIRAESNELRIELDAPGIGRRAATPAPVTPAPTPLPTPEPAPPAPVEASPEPEAAAPAETADVGEPVAPPTADEEEPAGGETASERAPVDPGRLEPEPLPDEPAPEPAPDASTPPPPIAPDFFEGAAPEPPPAEAPVTEPAPDAIAAPPEPAPVEPAPVEPAPLDDDAPAATRVFEVVREDRDGVLAVRIPTNGRPSYQAFFTEESPERLVLDFEGAESRPLFQRLDVGVGPVRRVRVGQHQAEPVPIVRVVVDLDGRVSHRIETDATGLTIRFDGVPVEP